MTKDDDGNVAGIELDALEDSSAFDDVDGEVNGLLSDEDLQAASELLAPAAPRLSSCGRTPGQGPGDAILEAGGHLVAHDRLDAETVQQSVGSSP